MNVMFLTFGPEPKTHYQACFAILTFLKESIAPNIHVFTDNPGLYGYFCDRITIHEISNSQLEEWKGHHQFFWRIKCKAVQTMAYQYPNDHLIYVDSDVFLHHGLRAEIAPLLDQGKALMHMNEGLLCKLTSKTERKTWNHLKGKSFHEIEINHRSAMWNAGVIAIPKQHCLQAADQILAVCDALCETEAPRRLLEQLSFSIVLEQQIGLTAANQWIGHYWGNKNGWNEAIKEFFLISILQNRSLKENIEVVKQFDFSAIAILRKEKNTKLKLQRWIDRQFPPKREIFFNGP